MKLKSLILQILLLILSACAYAQTISKDELIFLTSEWKGDRFAEAARGSGHHNDALIPYPAHRGNILPFLTG